MLMETVKQLKFKTGLPLRAVCRQLRVPWSSYGRWGRRAAAGTAPVRPPGPAKSGMPDLDAIRQEVRRLRHGTHRTAGTTALYQRHHDTISRRELAVLVEEARRESVREYRTSLRHLAWLRTGVAWSMDATECEKRSKNDGRMFVHQVEELCSRYKLMPIGGECPNGEEIAAHLDSLLCANPAPLFLKRDNGGNMNHPAVDDVLAKHFVMPLNSPYRCARYNGAVERAQGDLKQSLDKRIRYVDFQNTADIEPYAQAAAQELNHVPRGCLGGKNACQVFFDPSRRAQFTKPQRRKAYDWIIERQNAIIGSAQQPVGSLTAWRVAARQWLVNNGLLTITVNKEVLPNYL